MVAANTGYTNVALGDLRPNRSAVMELLLPAFLSRCTTFGAVWIWNRKTVLPTATDFSRPKIR